VPQLPPGLYGVNEDNDIGAINEAAWVFASPANSAGDPLTALRAAIAVEYLVPELKENPRWIAVDTLIKMRLTRSRGDLRGVLGIRPDAPAQAVINAMLSTGQALNDGDRAAALVALASPVFTFAPERTLDLLTNLPPVPAVNFAMSQF
jgi:hypothetical protein